TTFGHEKGPIPEADEYYDVREVPDTKEAEEDEAQHLASEITPGHSVAIGCHHGEFTSPHIAELLRQNLDNVQVTHRDMYVEPVHHGNGAEKMPLPRDERIRSLKHKGFSEEQAIKWS